jgi:hypothetical protein
MANVAAVLKTAQSHMNDFNQKNWTKDQLRPFLAEAHRDLQLELQVNGIPVIKRQSVAVTIPAIVLATWPGYVIMPNQPTNIVEPITCYERPTGDNLNSDWDEMTQKSFIPKQEAVNDLVYWSWIGEVITFLGATQSNDVQLEYNGGILIPVADNDPMGFINAEAYIAPRLAFLALNSIGAQKTAMVMEKLAEVRLEKILEYNILAEQGMVSRRKPYRHGQVTQIIR